MRLSDHIERAEDINLITYGDNFDAILRGMAKQLQKIGDANLDKEVSFIFIYPEIDTNRFSVFRSNITLVAKHMKKSVQI